ncbi:MAG: sigma-70 family RNA polymerase sigma factor [Phycisphaerae bacterium]|nr:sigma-70 family RNA polymerase sigma factor [Phycisphaerae bacterium]
MDHALPHGEDDWARRTSAAVAGGSREALASLYERRFSLLFRTVRDSTRGDESFALDCVQDAMLRVARALEPMESAVALDAWLRRVALNAALDRLRSERARSAREARHRVAGDAGDVDERCDEIARALRELDDDERELLRLRLDRGLTLAELSRHLNLAPKALESRIRRILARLRARLGLSASTPEGDSP